MPKSILILEDNDERIAAFQKTVAELEGGFELKIWRDAPSMIAACEAYFQTAALISLDHDLNPMPGATRDLGNANPAINRWAIFGCPCGTKAVWTATAHAHELLGPSSGFGVHWLYAALC